MALRSMLTRGRERWLHGRLWAKGMASESGEGSTWSQTGASSRPFNLDEDAAMGDRDEREDPHDRKVFKDGKWQKEFVEGVHVMRGWGKYKRVRTIPPHQRGGIFHSEHHIRISPQKLNQFCTMLRKKSVPQAMAQMEASVTKPARIIKQAIETAMEKADENNCRIDRMQVAELIVGRGIRVVHIRPWHGRGRYGKGTKYRAHLTVVLKELSDKEYIGRYHSKERPVAPKPKATRRRGVLLPPKSLMPKPWLVRRQVDITAIG